MENFEEKNGKYYVFGTEVPENGVVNVTYPNGYEGTVKVTFNSAGKPTSIDLGKGPNIGERLNPFYYGPHGNRIQESIEDFKKTNFKDTIYKDASGKLVVSRISFENDSHIETSEIKIGEKVKYNGKEYIAVSTNDGDINLQVPGSEWQLGVKIGSENKTFTQTQNSTPPAGTPTPTPTPTPAPTPTPTPAPTPTPTPISSLTQEEKDRLDAINKYRELNPEKSEIEAAAAVDAEAERTSYSQQSKSYGDTLKEKSTNYRSQFLYWYEF